MKKIHFKDLFIIIIVVIIIILIYNNFKIIKVL